MLVTHINKETNAVAHHILGKNALYIAEFVVDIEEITHCIKLASSIEPLISIYKIVHLKKKKNLFTNFLLLNVLINYS